MDEECAAPESSPAKPTETGTAAVTAAAAEVKEPVAAEEPEKAAPAEAKETKSDVTAAIEVEVETETAEEAPVVTNAQESTTKMTASMKFEERKKARAARFGIPIVNDPSLLKAEKKTGKKRNSNGSGRKEVGHVGGGGGGDNKKQKRDPPGKKDGGNAKKQEKKDAPKKQEKKDAPKTDAKPAEPPLMPKDEILKRLERAKKFNTGDTVQIDELKAMLRRHRFGGN